VEAGGNFGGGGESARGEEVIDVQAESRSENVKMYRKRISTSVGDYALESWGGWPKEDEDVYHKEGSERETWHHGLKKPRRENPLNWKEALGEHCRAGGIPQPHKSLGEASPNQPAKASRAGRRCLVVEFLRRERKKKLMPWWGPRNK